MIHWSKPAILQGARSHLEPVRPRLRPPPVPAAMPPSALEELRQWLLRARAVCVLTGAGCSTGSGIPDYRDDGGNWKHRRPVQFADFLASDETRRRYWARSMAGWARIAQATPNAAHLALAQLEAKGQVASLITQNVDGLHQRAGSRRVIDLHGRLDTVRCLDCAARLPREAFQRQLEALNPGWRGSVSRHTPDGDAELHTDDFSRFRIPACTECGGVMKPDVVFFGEAVPRERVTSARDALESADLLLVVGSSLMVWSGFRFAKRADELGIPVVAINRGRTRADALLALKIEHDCGEALERMVSARTCALSGER